MAVPVAARLETVGLAEEQNVCEAEPVGAAGAVLTVIVIVEESWPLQYEGETPVAKTLNVVVDVSVPVGKFIVPPVPATALPTSVLPVLFLS